MKMAGGVLKVEKLISILMELQATKMVAGTSETEKLIFPIMDM